MGHPDSRLGLGAIMLFSTLIGLPASGAPPGEVTGVAFEGFGDMHWDAVFDADAYNVYRGDLAALSGGAASRCISFGLDSTGVQIADVPEPGQGLTYLVSAESGVEGEGSVGGRDERCTASALGPVRDRHARLGCRPHRLWLERVDRRPYRDARTSGIHR